MQTEKTLTFPWPVNSWPKRARLIASLIPRRSSVLDLGGGFGKLVGCLDNPKKYDCVDLEKWTKNTIVADFNKGQFPDLGLYDYVVCQGVLEYIQEPLDFLRAIQKYGGKIILTYRTKNDPPAKNLMTFTELSALFYLAKLEVCHEEVVSRRQKLFVLERKIK